MSETIYHLPDGTIGKPRTVSVDIGAMTNADLDTLLSIVPWKDRPLLKRTVDTEKFHRKHREPREPECLDCKSDGMCNDSPLPGILARKVWDPSGTTIGYSLERCDGCERYPGDLEAAKALADHLGHGVVLYVDAEDFDPDNNEDDFAALEPSEDLYRPWNGGEKGVIAYGTDPFVPIVIAP